MSEKASVKKYSFCCETRKRRGHFAAEKKTKSDFAKEKAIVRWLFLFTYAVL